MKRFGRKKEFTTTRIIAVGFFVAIVIGTFLLMLPLSSKTGKVTGIVDALFTSTTSVCVTGLVTVPTYAHWSLFGQVVIALLAQVGGLGVITFTTMFMLILRRRIGMKERLLIQDAYNLDTIQGLVVLVKKILKGTLVVETVGALLYMTVFIPDYGWKGVWYSVFNAVSAFCNAGMDVIGPDSLSRYVGNPVVNITTMGLIILGGLGFPVWWNVLEGKSIQGLKKDQLAVFRRRKIGFIFQNYNLVPDLNVYENVILPVELDGRRVDTAYVDEILGLLGLTEKRDALPGNLSGGQQQRAAIARALAAKPAIILADEPTGNLDSATSHDVLGLLKMASKQFCQTLILITHDRDIAQLADRIVHIEDGRIIGGLEKGSDPDA